MQQNVCDLVLYPGVFAYIKLGGGGGGGDGVGELAGLISRQLPMA